MLCSVQIVEHEVLKQTPLQVLLASACSGHGFKMSPRIGQLLAREATCSVGDAQKSAYGGEGDTQRGDGHRSAHCGQGGSVEGGDVRGALDLDELAQHRISAARLGHKAFIDACHGQ